MRFRTHLLVLILALLAAVPAFAQGQRGWLGVEVQDVTKEEADRLRWDAPHGAKVRTVQPGSPADKAGVRAGDIILLLDGVEVETSAGFESVVAAKPSGTEVRIKVLSGGREVRMAMTVTERQGGAVAINDPNAVPQLMLDTGGHMALVRGLAFTPDGKLLVSGAEDKVIRIWDWQTGKTVRTIRGQAGPGPEGKVFAMAMTSDARWLAVGGWSDTSSAHVPCCGDIRLFEFSTGRLAAVLKGHTSVIVSMGFSRDDKLLMSGSGLGDGSAIIWDVATRRIVHQLRGHKSEVYGVGFTPDSSRAVTASFDKTAKIWSVSDGRELFTLTGHKDKISAMAVSPWDGMIATGGGDGEIKLWNSGTGQLLRTLPPQGGYVGALKFVNNGRWVVSTCGYSGCNNTQRVWDVSTGKEVLSYKRHDDSVLSINVAPDGRTMATGGGANQAVHVWDLQSAQGKRVLAGNGAPGWAAGFSPDGKRIAWGFHPYFVNIHARGPLERQMRLPGARQSLGIPESIANPVEFVRARGTVGNISLSHRKGGDFGYDAYLDISKDGKQVASILRDATTGYGHWAYTLSPDGQTIVTGGANGIMAAYDLQGRKIGDYIGHEGVVWSVAASPDGRLLLSGSADQTLRLWNIKTRELIATLFHATDGEWVMWTPQGYYTSSPGADRSVGWQINKGAANAADYVGADQLKTHLNRPDIVEKAIILASAEQAVRQSPGTSFKLADLLARPVPKFRITSPAIGSTVRGGRVEVKIEVEQVRDPIKAIRVHVNGNLVQEITPDVGAGGFTGTQSFDVPVGRGRNDVRITLSNDIGDKADTVVLNHEGEGDLDKRGTLYILAVGVDRYPGLGNTCGEFGTSSCDLRYSGADAERLVKAAEQRLGPAHTKVVKRVLVNGGAEKDTPSASNIIDAIDMLREAKENDTVLLFIAGHGYNEGPSYRFLATNAERSGSTFRGVTVVPWQILQDAVERAKGRRILFIDTCHSGNAYNQTLGNAAYHANIIAYTSARFDQEALEDASLGHGLFSYAVSEAFDGKGDFGSKREISTKSLADYVVKRVDQLAKALKGEQHPQYFRGRDADDYVLAKW